MNITRSITRVKCTDFIILRHHIKALHLMLLPSESILKAFTILIIHLTTFISFGSHETI